MHILHAGWWVSGESLEIECFNLEHAKISHPWTMSEVLCSKIRGYPHDEGGGFKVIAPSFLLQTRWSAFALFSLDQDYQHCRGDVATVFDDVLTLL